MKKLVFVLVFVLIFGPAITDVFGRTVTIKSISSGVYQDGKFTPGSDEFAARCVIDERAGIIELEEIIQSDREGRIEKGATYEVTNTLKSEGLSGLLVSRDKKGQKIMTGIRDMEVGVTEILIVGEDFYEYCRGANGKFYLESGKVISDNE